MNIREYYQKTAKACFCVAWISLLLAIIFFVCHLLQLFEGDLLIFVIPIIIFSVLHFFYFRIYDKRVEKLGDKPMQISGQLLSIDHVLVVFMPAPTLRMLLFDSKGLLLGEVRDQNTRWFMWLIPNVVSLLLPKRFILLDSDGQVRAKYHTRAGLTNSMTIYNADDEIIGGYRENWKDSLIKIKGIIYKGNQREWIAVESKASLYSLQLKTIDKKNVASFQEGWMPVEWAKRFELNTPIITFSSIINEQERVIILGFLAAVLHHRDH
ncbi:hypothetical protein D1953_20090 [Peribacillus asahii]|uniref:Uncharacterized protein n=1 Tax=Peribacillus asahii TaxID=228899 RepID=A0A398B0Y9_9BACI|nr:hypothetical protein [Peribacillus asahii]RID81640.1 hypothetical protein D1953_20090 [Peribacillus asahii]